MGSQGRPAPPPDPEGSPRHPAHALSRVRGEGGGRLIPVISRPPRSLRDGSPRPDLPPGSGRIRAGKGGGATPPPVIAPATPDRGYGGFIGRRPDPSGVLLYADIVGVAPGSPLIGSPTNRGILASPPPPVVGVVHMGGAKTVQLHGVCTTHVLYLYFRVYKSIVDPSIGFSTRGGDLMTVRVIQQPMVSTRGSARMGLKLT